MKFELAVMRLFFGYLRATPVCNAQPREAPVSAARPAFFNSTRITCARIAGSRRIRSTFMLPFIRIFSRPNSRRRCVSRNH